VNNGAHYLMSAKSEPTSATHDSFSRLTYTKAELCKALNLSPVTLWRLEQKGSLVPLAGIRHKIYPVSAVEKFLKRGAA